MHYLCKVKGILSDVTETGKILRISEGRVECECRGRTRIEAIVGSGEITGSFVGDRAI